MAGWSDGDVLVCVSIAAVYVRRDGRWDVFRLNDWSVSPGRFSDEHVDARRPDELIEFDVDLWQPFEQPRWNGVEWVVEVPA